MKADRATGLFWLAVSLVVAVGSYRLGLGSISSPGSGFVPFGAAVLLGLLSVFVFLRAAATEKGAPEREPLFRNTLWLKAALVFVALFAYTLIIPVGGYNIATFLIMTFLFWIAGRQKLYTVILYALVTTSLSYYVFSKLLNLQFPAGPLGF